MYSYCAILKLKWIVNSQIYKVYKKLHFIHYHLQPKYGQMKNTVLQSSINADGLIPDDYRMTMCMNIMKMAVEYCEQRSNTASSEEENSGSQENSG